MLKGDRWQEHDDDPADWISNFIMLLNTNVTNSEFINTSLEFIEQCSEKMIKWTYLFQRWNCYQISRNLNEGN